MEDALDRLLEAWRRQGFSLRAAATSDAIADFERRHGVSLPADLRDYFLTADGMGDGGVTDEHDLWFMLFARCEEASADKYVVQPPPYERCLVFADYLIGSHFYGVYLDGPLAGQVVLIGGVVPCRVAGSFAEFIAKYLDSPLDLFKVEDPIF